ncbi:MAG: hypothetical protein ACRYFZ_12185 [Janthinobacterium lividum]
MVESPTLPISYSCWLMGAAAVSLSIIVGACTAESDTKQSPVSEKLASSPSPLNVAHETNVADSLAALYKVTRSSALLVAADSIACQADGDAMERISMASVELYNADKEQFFRVVYIKKLRCLEHVLALGLSENMSVLQGAKRNKALSQVRLSAVAATQRLDKEESANAKAIINQVNPALFD